MHEKSVPNLTVKQDNGTMSIMQDQVCAINLS